jgi:PAS domain S-box-containing protein
VERDKFKGIISALSEGLDIIDKNYRVVFQNKMLRDRYGDITGKLCYEGYMKRKTPCDFCLIKKAIKTGKTQKIELTAPDGKSYELVSTPFKDIDGKTKVIEIVRDITERKKSEEKMKESEERFRGLFDHMSSGVIVYEAVDNGKDFVFRDFNRAAEKIENVRRKIIIGRSVLEVFPGIKDFGLFDVFKRVWKTGKPEHHPVTLYKDNRIAGWRENYVFKLPSGEIVAVYDDITQRKIAEGKIEESEKRFRKSIIDAPLPIMIHKENGEVVSINDAWTEISGYTKKDIPTIEAWTEKAFVKRRNIVKKAIDKLYRMDKRVDEGELEIRTKSGARRIWHFSSAPLGKSPDGIRLVISMALDVTERKEREEEYKKLINGMNDTAFVIDFNGKFIEVNDTAIQVLGYSREELLSMGPADIDSTLDGKDIGRLIEGMKQGEKQVFPTTHKTKSGEVIPVEISSSLVTYHGKPAILSIARNITERKKAEEELRISEAKYRAIFENTGTATIIIEENKIISLANKEFEELSGFSKDEIEGKIYWPDFVVKEDLEKMLLYHKERREKSTKVPRNYEFRFVDKDKKIKNIFITVDIIPNTSKSVASLLDITERKKMMEEVEESEERFQILIENLPHGVCLHDLDGRILLVNKAACEMTGYTQEEMLNMNVAEIDPGSRAREDREKLWLKLEKGGFSRMESVHYHKDGSSFPVEICISAINFRGNPMILAIVHNIADRKDALEHLRKSEEKYRNLYESMMDAFVSLDMEGNIIGFNKQYLNMVGYSEDGIKGYKFTDFTPEKWHHMETEIIEKQILKIGYSDVYEKEYIRKDGTVFPVELRGFLLKDDKGNPKSIWKIVRDITERKKMENEFRKIERLESLGVLAGGIAHDFNNLLTGILGNLSLAQIKKGEDTDEILEEAKQASIQAKNLTQQLLTFAKGGEPIKGEASIEDIIKVSAGFTLHGSNVKCIYDFPTDLWKVEVDKGQISQVIDNLVINAKQAMPEGGKIKIKAENFILKKGRALHLPKGKYIKITVTDEGMGIPEKHLARIFDPYFTTKQKGSGLGLATVYSIIRKHGGIITVESEVGKGTTFFIYLPIMEEKKNKGAEEKGKIESYLFGKGTILIMDDEGTVRNTIGGILKRLGYTVVLTQNGDEAIEKYREALDSGKPFDVVILDLTVAGGMGGKEAMEKLLQIDPNVKAIVSSGYSTDPIMAHYEEYGFSDVVVKPYDVYELDRALKKVLE